MEIFTAVYTNTILGETYRLAGVTDLAMAWRLAGFVANRMNWNLDMFSYDVRVRLDS